MNELCFYFLETIFSRRHQFHRPSALERVEVRNGADINSWFHFLLEESKLWNLFVSQFPYLKHRLRSACLMGLVCELNETILVKAHGKQPFPRHLRAFGQILP